MPVQVWVRFLLLLPVTVIGDIRYGRVTTTVLAVDVPPGPVAVTETVYVLPFVTPAQVAVEAEVGVGVVVEPQPAIA